MLQQKGKVGIRDRSRWDTAKAWTTSRQENRVAKAYTLLSLSVGKRINYRRQLKMHIVY